MNKKPESLVEKIKSFMPVPNRVRRAYIQAAQERVEFYKPQIEALTGVKLGNIEVVDEREFIENTTRNIVIDAISDLERDKDIIIKYVGTPLAYPLIYAITAITELLDRKNAIMSYVFPRIHVFFNKQFKQRKFQSYEGTIDDVNTVHEMSHHLWRY
jgi:hypothetical protein